MAAFFADPTMMLFLSKHPAGPDDSFPGSPLTAETVAKVVAAANDVAPAQRNRESRSAARQAA